MMHHRTPCTDAADDRARRLQTRRTPCTESADDRARRLSPHRTPCTVRAPCLHADLRALLAQPATVRTSAAHLAFRPILHPVLAWPLRVRGSLPLRALLHNLLFLTLRVLDFTILVEGHSHARPPDRRRRRRHPTLALCHRLLLLLLLVPLLHVRPPLLNFGRHRVRLSNQPLGGAGRDGMMNCLISEFETQHWHNVYSYWRRRGCLFARASVSGNPKYLGADWAHIRNDTGARLA